MKKRASEVDAYLNSMGLFSNLDNYINSLGGRFFFNADNTSGKLFFDNLSKLLPELKQSYSKGKLFYRARIVECRTGHCELNYDAFEAFSKEELGAPPVWKACDGRVNPKGISYLYLSDSRRCALAEVRPNISSLVAIGEGAISKDIKLISFAKQNETLLSQEDRSFYELLKRVFSAPTNGQLSTEYLPSQVIAEFIKLKGYDGIEYISAQEKHGTNITLFDTSSWSATGSRLFEVSDIRYTAQRERGRVEILGYPDEEL